MSEPKDVVLKKVDGCFDTEGVKRQYMPYIIEWTCPDCGERNTWDLRDQYLSYPPFNKPYDLEFYCCGGQDTDDGWEECGYIGQKKAIVRLTLEFVDQ
jgi:hypothetical protein